MKMKTSCLALAAAALLQLQAATAQTISTVVATGVAGFSGDGGPATAATMSEPRGLSFDASGNLYISDRWNYRIRKVDASSVISTIAGNGSGAVSNGVPATASGMVPYLLAVDATGNIYHADATNGYVRKINTSGIITTIAGNGLCVGPGGGGVATATPICQNDGVAIDNSGNVIFSNSSADVVYRISPAGMLTVVAGTGSSLGDGGAATNAQLANPLGLAVDISGNIYIADASHHRIRKINTSGIISTVAGSGTMGFSGDGGSATSAMLNNPYAIVTDSFGYVFFTDRDNNRVRVVYPSGIIMTIAGNGTAAFGGDGGPATAASLNVPAGLALKNGILYIADAANNRVRKMNLKPGDISGVTSVCQGATITMGNTTTGGSWSSGSTSIATIGSADGIVTGIAAGTAAITYSSYGYSTTTMVTVTGIPAAGPITGATSVCEGAAVTLTGGTAGGTWTSSTSGASVAGGVVTGVTAGSAIISYTVSNVCGADTATLPITIDPLPVAGTVTAAPTVCIGATVTVSSTAAGGTWSSADASVSVSGAVVTGVSAGTASISYFVTNSCGSASVFTPITVIDCAAAASVSTLSGAGNLLLYPVPAGNELFIANGSILGRVTIRDIYGRTVLNVQYDAAEAVINLSDLAVGTYFLSTSGYKPVAFLKK
jgi:hypothetical protein